MAGRTRAVNLKPRTIEMPRDRDGVVAGLHARITALEKELAEARNGIDHLTVALRRRGCCDTHTTDAPH